MSREQYCFVLFRCKLMEHSHNLNTANCIKKSSRFIKDDKRTLLYQSFCYHYLLSFTIRQFSSVAARFMSYAYPVKSFLYNFMIFFSHTSEETCMRLPSQCHKLVNSKSPCTCFVCEYHSDTFRLLLLAERRDRLVVKQQCPRKCWL